MTTNIIPSLFQLVSGLQDANVPIRVKRSDSHKFVVVDEEGNDAPILFMLSNTHVTLRENTKHPTLCISPITAVGTLDFKNAMRDIVTLCIFGLMSLDPSFNFDPEVIRSLRMTTSDGIHINREQNHNLEWNVRCSPSIKYWSKKSRTQLAHLDILQNKDTLCKARVIIELSHIIIPRPHEQHLDFVVKHVEVDDIDDATSIESRDDADN